MPARLVPALYYAACSFCSLMASSTTTRFLETPLKTVTSPVKGFNMTPKSCASRTSFGGRVANLSIPSAPKSLPSIIPPYDLE